MANLVAVRVSLDLKRRLERRAAAEEIPVSEFVRRAIEKALESEPEPSLYESIKHLIGSVESGRADLAERHDEIIEEELRAEHNRRRHRSPRRNTR